MGRQCRSTVRCTSALVLIAFFALLVIPAKAYAVTFPTAPVPADDVLGQNNFDDSSPGTFYTRMNYPTGSDVDPINHRLFVADGENERVLVFELDSDNQPIDNVADYVLGQTDFTSNGSGLSATQFNLDDGSLVYDEVNNRLFVSDEGNCRIMVFDTTTITNGMAATNVLGQPDFDSNNCNADQASFDYNESTPAYDPDRQLLFVPEFGNNRVMVFDVNSITNGEDAVYVLGQPDFTSDNSGTSASVMDYPGALAVDQANQLLYVADTDNCRILVFDVKSITNGEDAIGVIGQPDFTSSSCDTTQTTLDSYDETGMAFDEISNTLYVADGYNNRVLIFANLYEDEVMPTGSTNPSTTITQESSTPSVAELAETGLNTELLSVLSISFVIASFVSILFLRKNSTIKN